MNPLAQMGSRADPVWQASRRAAAYVMRSAWRGPRSGRVARVQRALQMVLPSAGQRFREALELVPPDRRGQRAVVQRAAVVALSNGLLDHYMALGLRVWESRSDPRVVNVLEKGGLAGGLGDSDLDKAGEVMKDVACNPATVGVVSGIVGAVTYGIGGAVVGTGGAIAQQQACPQGAQQAPTAPTPAPAPAPAPPPRSTLPTWVLPVTIGSVFFLLLGGFVIYGASQ